MNFLISFLCVRIIPILDVLFAFFVEYFQEIKYFRLCRLREKDISRHRKAVIFSEDSNVTVEEGNIGSHCTNDPALGRGAVSATRAVSSPPTFVADGFKDASSILPSSFHGQQG